MVCWLQSEKVVAKSESANVCVNVSCKHCVSAATAAAAAAAEEEVVWW